MKVARLSVLRTGRLYTQEIFLVLISVRGLVDPRAIVRPKELCQWKIPVTQSWIDSATFRFVAPCLNYCATACPFLFIIGWTFLYLYSTFFMYRKNWWMLVLMWIIMFVAHYVQTVPQWDIISEVQISESGNKHSAVTILSITSGIWDECNNTQAVTAVAASHLSFSVICDDQECPARMWSQHSLTLRSCIVSICLTLQSRHNVQTCWLVN
jgi:hypothetical protein